MIAGQIETKKVYEDELALAFHDIDPRAPVHVLIIPKRHISSLKDVNENDQEVLGHLLLTASKVADKLGVGDTGYRVAINAGADAGQAVAHLHLHLLGGRKLDWPPG